MTQHFVNVQLAHIMNQQRKPTATAVAPAVFKTKARRQVSGLKRSGPSLHRVALLQNRSFKQLSKCILVCLSTKETDMENNQAPVAETERRPPWNKGKLIGPKPPLRPSQVWAIRTRLQMENRKRDLALFNLAIDSKLRGCDVVAIRVEDVAPSGYALDRATIRQKKTGRPVRFELTDQTRSAIDDYLRLTGRKPAQVLF